VANVYDDAGRVTSVTNAKANATVLSSFAYGYDNDNLQTSITEANSDVISFGYNAAHRLIVFARG
jgi:YD repeat-containing protein